MTSLQAERESFNRIARERSENRFRPDLRNMGSTDYFYLSPFRRQELAQLTLGEDVEFARRTLGTLGSGSSVLDIGCGNGWFSLELARLGLNVTAIDVSDESIRVARETYKTADLSPGCGSVRYHVGDAINWTPPHNRYDSICFRGALHHFIWPERVVDRFLPFLKSPAHLFSIEPIESNYGWNEAAIALIVRLALCEREAWFESLDVPHSGHQWLSAVRSIRDEYRSWSDRKGDGNQSPMNNATTGANVLRTLRRRFECLDQSDMLPLIHRLIGGVRLGDDVRNLTFARVWRQVEERLLSRGSIRAGGFRFWGRARTVPLRP